MDRVIKFRQPLFTYNDLNSTQAFRQWHYWGFIDGGFIGPETHYVTISEAQKLSQQFTGLLDRDGKEIYEGDVVDEYGTPRQVVFQPGAFGTIDRYGDLTLHSSTWEVIGNIYEHPELLEKEANDSPTQAANAP